jgi:hypothetical protein
MRTEFAARRQARATTDGLILLYDSQSVSRLDNEAAR